MTVSQNFLVFYEFDSFKECWSCVLWNVPQLWFVWCFLMRPGLKVLGRKILEVKCHCHHIRSTSIIILDLTLIICLIWVCQLSHSKDPPSLPTTSFPHFTLGKKSECTIHENLEYAAPPWKHIIYKNIWVIFV